MKISIICPYLSGNAFGRAYTLATILQHAYEVEIIGPKSDSGIWYPLRNEAVKVRSVEVGSGIKKLSVLRKLYQFADLHYF